MLYANKYAMWYWTSSIRDNVSRNSSSVSPQNPQMKSEERVTPNATIFFFTSIKSKTNLTFIKYDFVIYNIIIR